MLMVLVAGVAVSGSRAQTIPSTSTAFEQCSGNHAGVQTQCLPLIERLAMAVEDGPGGDRELAGLGNGEGVAAAEGLGSVDATEAGADISPEHNLFQHAVNVAAAAVAAVAATGVHELFTHYLSNALPITLDFPIASSLFDTDR
jgi:hypothetical protein